MKTYSQTSPYASPWTRREKIGMLLWSLAWPIFCAWTPKPLNRWRLFWLRVFGAKLSGQPFVHQRARIAMPWHLTLHDRACVGDRANLYSLGEIEIHEDATVAQEAYLCTGTHDFSSPNRELQTAKITIGAGAVIGAMAALAGRRAPVDVVGLVGLVENMPSSTAQRPGDVVTSYSGQTVEIINTDAEGRLVLGDVMWYCQERFKPAFMVDLATLTGGIIVSLGHEYAGLFSNDDALAQKLQATGTAWGEKLWRMPLGDAYDKMLKSEIADMKNVGGRPGGSISAACFIQRFTNGVPWAHLDIAGTAWSSKDNPTIPKGATAFGVRLIDRLVAEHYEGTQPG